MLNTNKDEAIFKGSVRVLLLGLLALLLVICWTSSGAHALAAKDWFESRTELPSHKHVQHLTDNEVDEFVLGKSFFSKPWVLAPSSTTARDGLGPLYNANACVACHGIEHLRQPLYKDGTINRSLVFKTAQPSEHRHRRAIDATVFDPHYGSQIAINGSGSVPFEANTHIKWETHTVTISGGEKVTLRKPIPYLTHLNYGKLDPKTKLSLRFATLLVGPGLISDVPTKEILSYADPNDKNHDGIKGRPNWVTNALTGKRQLGRFGYKASEPDSLQQTANAAFYDMGLSNPVFPEPNCTSYQTACLNDPQPLATPEGVLDLPILRLKAIAFYLDRIRAPENIPNLQSLEGFKIFSKINCVACHRPEMKTSKGIVFQPFSDLLLHNMGSGLSDNRPEFEAGIDDWRTTPLWGLGSKVKAGIPLLHDGRAKTIMEAILWHGGEAAASEAAFAALSPTDRQTLIKFLESL